MMHSAMFILAACGLDDWDIVRTYIVRDLWIIADEAGFTLKVVAIKVYQ